MTIGRRSFFLAESLKVIDGRGWKTLIVRCRRAPELTSGPFKEVNKPVVKDSDVSITYQSLTDISLASSLRLR